MPSDIVRGALELFAAPPRADRAGYQAQLAAVLDELAALGLCCVHTMDPPETLFALQRPREAGRLPLLVVVNLPAATLDAGRQAAHRSGWGDGRLRVWGGKAFLDGSLGSQTAERLDGSGVARLPDPEPSELIASAAAAELNVCLHAIGDRAVRRALVALEAGRPPWPGQRPRIEHVQCVDPEDLPRFRRTAATASRQPSHAPGDRLAADRPSGPRTRHSHAWRVLRRAGVPLALGSDTPSPPRTRSWSSTPPPGLAPRAGSDPDAGPGGVHPGGAVRGRMEWGCGRPAPRCRCDLTVVHGATVVGGRVVHSLPAPPQGSAPGGGPAVPPFVRPDLRGATAPPPSTARPAAATPSTLA